MSTPPGKLTVLAGNQFACVKIAGRANFTLSIDFQSLVNELHTGGYSFVVVDLSECLLMDSTFLGMLTGFGLKMMQPNGGGANRVVELLNPNSRISELLENLGVLHLFRVRQGQLSAPDCVQESTPQPANPSQGELTRACLEAHQTLMALSPENAAKFKDVAHFLADELQKQKTPR
jgi:anti-sigma B factor antagonist